MLCHFQSMCHTVFPCVSADYSLSYRGTHPRPTESGTTQDSNREDSNQSISEMLSFHCRSLFFSNHTSNWIFNKKEMYIFRCLTLAPLALLLLIQLRIWPISQSPVLSSGRPHVPGRSQCSLRHVANRRTKTWSPQTQTWGHRLCMKHTICHQHTHTLSNHLQSHADTLPSPLYFCVRKYENIDLTRFCLLFFSFS